MKASGKQSGGEAMKYCIDCGNYKTGGYCRKTGERICALQEQCCDNKPVKRKVIEPLTHKTFPKCGKTLPVDRFAKNKAALDGLQHYCKECNYEAYKKWLEAKPGRKRGRVRKLYGDM